MPLNPTQPDRFRMGKQWLSLLLVFLFGGIALAMATPAGAASVAAGENSSCALKHDGTVWCWGSADEGLGDAAGTVRSATPVRVKGLTGVTDLAVGYQFACAVKSDRTVTCWGYGDYGQLGHGAEDSSATPVPVALIGNIEMVAAGEYHACALRSGGTVACWGENDDGQLGDGTTDDRATPVLVDGISTAIGVAAGGDHSCAVLGAGNVKCWGKNDDGQLGDGEDDGFETIPIDVTGGVNNAIAIAAGDKHSCALRSSGKIACWGYNSYGQLGDGTNSRQPVPVAVTGLTEATAITAGGINTCAISNGRKVHCWGDNERGQLGTGTTVKESRVPVAIAGLTTVIEVSAGNNQICASSPNRPGSGHDVVRCWGNGAMGQLGNGMLGSSNSPIPVPDLTDVMSVALGDQHSCVVVDPNRVACWGNNRFGQLGSGEIPTQPSPRTVPGLDGTTALAAGNYFSCAVRDTVAGHDRRISCWGSDDSGQLGVGGQPGERAYTPVDLDLTPVLTHVDARIALLAAGDDFACALTRIDDATNGDTWCWGRSDYGQTGSSNNPPFSEKSPVKVERPPQMLTKADQSDGPTLATGSNHACVISSHRGQVWCWGANWYGQIGDGTAGTDAPPGDVQKNNRMRPVRVKYANNDWLEGAVAVNAGRSHTCALFDSGEVECWGQGTSGQLGDGLGTNSPHPVQTQIDGVSSLSLGENQSCAILNGGGISCWGFRYDDGFPVPGDTVPQRTPSPVQGITDAASVSVGLYHSCFATPMGAVSCWASDTQDFRYATAAPHGDGAMPTGHYPVQRVATPVIGFEADDPPVLPARPNHPRVELRDGKLRLRGLPLKRKGNKPCPKKVKAVVTARVTFKQKGRKVKRVVKTRKFLKLKQAANGCRVSGAVKFKGRLAKVKKVKLKLAGKGLKQVNRTVKAKSTVAVRGAKLKINRFPVRSTSTEICPLRAKVIVTGATKATRKHRKVRKNAPVAMAPVAGCQVTVGFKLPPKLRRAKKIKVAVKGPGLKLARRTIKSR